MRRRDLLLICAVVTLLVVAAVPGMCQPGGQGGGRMGAQGGGMGGPGMGPGTGPGMMPPAAPQTTMVVADGVLYVACEGKVIAYDAKTLEKIAEARYWEPPARPQGGRGAGGPEGG